MLVYTAHVRVSVCIYEGGLKGFRPSLRETGDKRPLVRESNRSWCRRHTKSMIKLFLVAAHGSMESWAATKKLYISVPTQRPLVPSFTSIVG